MHTVGKSKRGRERTREREKERGERGRAGETEGEEGGVSGINTCEFPTAVTPNAAAVPDFSAKNIARRTGSTKSSLAECAADGRSILRVSLGGAATRFENDDLQPLYLQQKGASSFGLDPGTAVL